MPLISVIIPVYNNAVYLESCVYSVLRLTNVDLECILIDDGSSDGSESICEQISSRDDRVIVLHQHNAGVSNARNQGIRYAKGKFLYFLDSDDVCMINDFSFLDPNVHLYIGQYSIGSEQHNHIVSSDFDSIKSYAIAYLNETLKCCVGSFIVQREIISKNSISFPLNIKYGEDQEFILKAITASQNVRYVANVWCLYRTNLDSAMYKISIDRFDVVISRIRMLEYFQYKNSEVYEYLKNTSIIAALVTVCEGLFRFGMPFYKVRHYLSENVDIQEYIFAMRRDGQLNHEGSIICSALNLKLLQLRVLKNNYIYKCRCKLSNLIAKVKPRN